MALGGKSILIMEEFPDMLEIDETIPAREEIEKDTIDWIKNIMIVQYSQITGKCPWEYTTGWHIMGYIRLDFTPAWMFFSFIIERLYWMIDKRFA